MDREITLRDYLRVAWSGRWLILATTIIGIVVGLLVSVARAPVYTATARVYLGQATTISGVVVATPYTNPQVAPLALDSDEIVRRVAQGADVRPGRVRDAVTLTAPRVTGSQGNQPTVLTVRAQDENRRLAVEIANGYAREVLAQTGRFYRQTQRIYEAQVADGRQQASSLRDEARQLRRQLTSASGTQAAQIQIALTYLTQELRDTSRETNDQQVLLEKADQVERPYIVSEAERASSSGTGPRRLQAVVLAGLIGLLIGILATFVWRGSPAARAAAHDTPS